MVRPASGKQSYGQPPPPPPQPCSMQQHISVVQVWSLLSAARSTIVAQECDLTKVKHCEKCVAGLGIPWFERTKPPEPPGCLILEDIQTLHIPTNKKLEAWTQIQATSFFTWWWRDICNKSWNQEKSREITCLHISKNIEDVFVLS